MFAVIFTNQRTLEDNEGYQQMAAEMDSLAKTQPGYISHDSLRNENGFGITVSYWETREAIAAWKNLARHRIAQKQGVEKWYQNFNLKICEVLEERSL